MTEIDSKYCEEIVKTWLEKYINLLSELTINYEKVFVLAISRKMPRFLNWIETKILKDFALNSEYYQLKSKIELTTEIAIPFIFGPEHKEHNDKVEVLIIDDTVVIGNTMRMVSSAVEHYLGKKPIAMPIVSRKEYTALQLGISTPYYPTLLAEDQQLQKWLEFVCYCNQTTSLPIDVEFPIVYPDKDFGYVHQAMETVSCGDQTTFKTYTINDDRKEDNVADSKDNIPKSFNLVDISPNLRDYRIDFLKLRLFDTTPLKLTVFAPRFLLSIDMLNPEIFKHPTLKEAWNKILVQLSGRDLDASRYYQTLAVCINYLYSLSALNKIFKDIECRSELHFNLQSDDLKLIFGSDFADTIYNYLEAILDSVEIESLPLGGCKLPTILAPQEFKDNYEIRRGLSMLDHRGKDVEIVLDYIFDISGVFDGLLSKYGSMFHRMHSYFYESFDSLNALFKNEPNSTPIKEKVNKWVDSRIDKGMVIPKYVEVTSNYGEKFWRRYFMNSNSCI